MSNSGNMTMTNGMLPAVRMMVEMDQYECIDTGYRVCSRSVRELQREESFSKQDKEDLQKQAFWLFK